MHDKLLPAPLLFTPVAACGDRPATGPAGNDAPHSGHHHLLIDSALPDPGPPIPKDENHIHFGDGSTETEITLPPGEHTLQMLLGDHRHTPHDPPVISEIITISVQ